MGLIVGGDGERRVMVEDTDEDKPGLEELKALTEIPASTSLTCDLSQLCQGPNPSSLGKIVLERSNYRIE